MPRQRTLDIQRLPAIFRFDAKGRLVVSASEKKLVLPVIELTDARLSTVERLVEGRQPHVIIAPHLSQRAKEAIESTQWGWVETNGNAHIGIEGVFIHIQLPDSQVLRRPGALTIPPQGERIVRQLLDTYPRTQRFSEIAIVTKLDKGYTSRILNRLRQTGLVSYARNEPVKVAYPAELFELWQSGPTRTVESHWFVGSPASLPRLAARVHEEAGTGRAAFTGVFAANLLSPHIEPERIECYVDDLRTATRVAEGLGGTRTREGANLVCLVHRDPGVMSIGIRAAEHLPLVSATQIYRDALHYGRGRERDAANEFRREILTW